jgi:hypothetical protein
MYVCTTECFRGGSLRLRVRIADASQPTARRLRWVGEPAKGARPVNPLCLGYVGFTSFPLPQLEAERRPFEPESVRGLVLELRSASGRPPSVLASSCYRKLVPPGMAIRTNYHCMHDVLDLQ